MLMLQLLPIAVLAAIVIVLILFSHRLYRAVLLPGADFVSMDKKITDILEANATFFDGAKREELSLRAEDGTPLVGYLIRGKSTRRFVILCHGYTMKARDLSGPASWFHGEGYSLLLPDARGHGRSGGSYIGMGWAERRDILEWIELLNRRFDTPEIVLYGISMGGATVMMVTGEGRLPSNVRAAIEDCGYTSVWEEFAYQLRHALHLPVFPLLHMVDRIARKRSGYGFREASAIRQVARSHTPTLFIHGDADTFVPYTFLKRIYDAASCEKEMLTVPSAPHGLAAPTNPELYWSHVRAFLGKYVTQS